MPELGLSNTIEKRIARMPAIFFGHGNPMNALHDNEWTRGWAAVGNSIPRPLAVLCISAHWYVSQVAVTAMENPRTIHDFGGFPRELFDVEYAAPGSPALAECVGGLLRSDGVVFDQRSWGLDHGTWSVLKHVFPEADIPVVQLSIHDSHAGDFHYEVARRLAPLRDEGVLIVGSGNIVHNLHAYAWGNEDLMPLDWAVRFDQFVRRSIAKGDHTPLVDYESLGSDAVLSAPTPDHYLPLLYVLGATHAGEKVSFPVSGFDGGSISMTAVQIG
jgi:4,5-DOPA dioxygenase extradiol